MQGAWFSELFNANTRTTGASLAYQISAVVSGFTPLIATALYIGTGWIGPAILFSVYGLLGLRRRAGDPRDLGPSRARRGRGPRARHQGGGHRARAAPQQIRPAGADGMSDHKPTTHTTTWRTR